ncbi:hypothetical protein HK101_011838 [Irineochytrium annulatum]|nr:hypothetical protein HK101_011838 [Irineochytrium annulatum]
MSGRHSRRATAENAEDPEREELINQVLDLQDILRGTVERMESSKTEYEKQHSENAMLLKYINNLMANQT